MSQTQHLGRTATCVHTEDGVTRVRYHATDVVAFDVDRVTLDSGGWRTATTKLRMNQAANQFGLRYVVFQKDFEWFVARPTAAGWTANIWKEALPFHDGMTFTR